MIKNLLFMVFLIIEGTCFGQIFMADSTAQAVAYWSLDETYEYEISVYKYKVKDGDTTGMRKMYYDVEMSILDSTENSYTVQWLYKNMKHSSLDSLFRPIPIENKMVFKTNELGEFEEVLDPGELGGLIQQTLNKIFKNSEKQQDLEEDTPQNAAELMNNDVFSGMSANKDLSLFLNFFGVKYKLGEIVEGEIEVDNFFGGEPFMADFAFMMDEIDLDEDTFRIRYQQEINKEQLIDEMSKFVIRLAEQMGTEPPEPDIFEGVENRFYSTGIIHESGWVVFAAQTMIVTMEGGDTTVEERYIEIK